MQKPSTAKETLQSLASRINLRGLRAFVRVDFNVPQDKVTGAITDDTRIRSSLPTIEYLSDRGAKVILCSHLGRPDGRVKPQLTLAPIAIRLAELVSRPVAFVAECVGPAVDDAISVMDEGSILLLENVRFEQGEEANDDQFARRLGSMADVYVNDAFGTAHRAHASTAGITKYVSESCAGLLMQKELEFLNLDSAPRPLAAIIGGAKVSTKLPVIENLLNKCDKLFLGGGLVFTFLKAQGHEVGDSMVEENMVSMASELLSKAQAQGVQVVLPVDIVCADEFSRDANSQIVSVADGVPTGWRGLDIGPNSIELFGREMSDVNTIIWNGPMGVFEFEKFSHGTIGIAQLLAERTRMGATTVVGGGDSVAAVEQAGIAHEISHVSTGGGATLELLGGEELPGVKAIQDARIVV